MASKSIVTNYREISTFSGAPTECEHHLVFGGSLRKLANEDGLTIYLKNSEHNMSMQGTIYQIHGNPAAEKLSKMLGQIAWEKQYIANKYSVSKEELDEARNKFKERYGKSFL